MKDKKLNSVSAAIAFYFLFSEEHGDLTFDECLHLIADDRKERQKLFDYLDKKFNLIIATK